MNWVSIGIFLIGFSAGFFVGFLLMGMMVIAKQSDRP